MLSSAKACNVLAPCWRRFVQVREVAAEHLIFCRWLFPTLQQRVPAQCYKDLLSGWQSGERWCAAI